MSDLETIDLEIDTAKQMIKTRDTLAILRKNKHFKEIIDGEYFTYEMNRLVMLKGKSMPDDIEKEVDKMLVGIAALNNYFNEVNRRGNQAARDLEGKEETRQELLVEETA